MIKLGVQLQELVLRINAASTKIFRGGFGRKYKKKVWMVSLQKRFLQQAMGIKLPVCVSIITHCIV